MPKWIIRHLFRRDFTHLQEIQLLEWCYALGADEFAFHGVVPGVIEKLGMATAPRPINMMDYKDQAMAIWDEERARPPVKVQTEIPPELKPFFKGVLPRPVFHPYHGSTTKCPVNVYSLNDKSMKLLTDVRSVTIEEIETQYFFPYKDRILYRNGCFMLGFVDHEDEGVLALHRGEWRKFKELGIRLGRWQKWVGVGEIE